VAGNKASKVTISLSVKVVLTTINASAFLVLQVLVYTQPDSYLVSGEPRCQSVW
jgi:hypothetical protein